MLTFFFFCGRLCFFYANWLQQEYFPNRLYRENWFAELDK